MARTARLPLALATLLATVFAGCTGNGDDGSETIQAWQDAAAAHGPMGVDSTFDLQTQGGLWIVGDGTLRDMAAPLTLWPGPDPFDPELTFVLFRDANLGNIGNGLLLVQADSQSYDKPSIAISAGELSDMPVARAGAGDQASASPRVDITQRPDPALIPAFAAQHAGLAFLAPASITNWRIDDAAGAWLLRAGGQTNLSFPLTFSATGLYWDDRGDDAITAARADVELDRFALFGDVNGGRVQTAGRFPLDAPKAVLGKDLELELTAYRARTVDDFRMTQAVTAAGKLALGAGVEIEPAEPTVTVPRGETRWVALDVRETSYTGDAVLQNVVVSNAPAGMVEVPVAQPPLLIEEMWDLIEQIGRDAPWAAPFFAVGVALMAPGLVLVDIFTAIACTFTFCPEEYPYPSWMDAGHVGAAYVKVTGTQPGTYAARITFEGQNYETVTVPMTIVVE